MRRRIVPISLALALASVLTLAGLASARPAWPQQGGLVSTRAAQAAPENHVPADVPSNENFGRAIYNHFGNPAAGQAVIGTWTRVTHSDAGLPITNQGFGSASRLLNVERIALRVILHTRGGTVSSGFSSP